MTIDGRVVAECLAPWSVRRYHVMLTAIFGRTVSDVGPENAVLGQLG